MQTSTAQQKTVLETILDWSSVGANIAYEVEGVPQPVEQWQNGANRHGTLSAVSVLDSDCASVPIREKNKGAFRPFGLEVPDELAAAC